MSAPAVRRATYEDVLRAPPNHITQVIFGVLHSMPRPAIPHARASSVLGALVQFPFGLGIGGPGGWLILDEPELHLGPEPDILVPDLAGWRLDRGQTPDQHAAWTTIAPDWVCEILSPSTASRDRVYKRRLYAQCGVASYWVVDPDARTLETFTLRDGNWVDAGAFDDTAVARIAPFEAVELPVGRLFLPRPPGEDGAPEEVR